MKIPQETAFVKHFLRMILKIVQIAVFSAPCFGVCAQFVRGAVREMRKKAGRAGTARPGGRRKPAHTRRGRGGNTAAANPNQSLLLKEKAGVRVGRTVRRFTACRHSL